VPGGRSKWHTGCATGTSGGIVAIKRGTGCTGLSGGANIAPAGTEEGRRGGAGKLTGRPEVTALEFT